MRKLLMRLLTLAATAAAAPGADATVTQVLVADLGNMPLLDQFDDYFGLMQGRRTDIGVPRVGVLTYEQLPDVPPFDVGPVHLDPDASDQWFWSASPPQPGNRFFEFDDYDDLAGGTYHCWPASAAMLMDYFSSRAGLGALAQGSLSDAEYIDQLAGFMDTNDQNPHIRATDARGHFGTFNGQVLPGVTEFVRSRDPSLAVRGAFLPFSAMDYKDFIDHRQPVMIWARNGGSSTGLGHAVVGVGYEIDDQSRQLVGLIVRDPALHADVTIGIPSSGSFVPTDVGGERFNRLGDIPVASFDAPLVDAIMLDMTVVRRPVATVPEPGTAALGALGLLGLLVGARRRRERRPGAGESSGTSTNELSKPADILRRTRFQSAAMAAPGEAVRTLRARGDVDFTRLA